MTSPTPNPPWDDTHFEATWKQCEELVQYHGPGAIKEGMRALVKHKDRHLSWLRDQIRELGAEPRI